jgi:hypothetical protein
MFRGTNSARAHIDVEQSQQRITNYNVGLITAQKNKLLSIMSDYVGQKVTKEDTLTKLETAQKAVAKLS